MQSAAGGSGEAAVWNEAADGFADCDAMVPNSSIQAAAPRKLTKKVSFSDSISTVSYSAADESSWYNGNRFATMLANEEAERDLALPPAVEADAGSGRGEVDGNSGSILSGGGTGGSGGGGSTGRSGSSGTGRSGGSGTGRSGGSGGGTHRSSSSNSSTSSGLGSVHNWFCRGWLNLPSVDQKFYADIGTGTWREVTFHMLTATATPAAYAPLPYAMARLTWYGGIPMMAFSIASSYYCALLTAELHTWKVIIRFCRYRDLGKSIWGIKGHHLVFVLQQLGSLGNNVAIQLSSALVMKDLYLTYNPAGNISLHIWLIIFACVQLVLCQLPTLHHLRHLNIFATFVTVVFAVLVSTFCIVDGIQDGRQGVSYDLYPGSTIAQVMAGFTSAGTIAFSLANILLPEIQAVAKPPAAKNGQKGVTAAFSVIGIIYPLVAIAGFWAFGNQVSSLVVLSLPPQHRWAAVTSKVLLVIHAAFNYQVFGQPSFEVIEYLLMDDSASLLSPKNCLSRFGGSLVYVMTLSFLAALLPAALPNVAVVIGAVCYINLDLVLPLLMHNTANRSGPLRRRAHIAGSCLWGCLALTAVVGAVYDLATNAKELRFFQNASR